MKRLVIATLLLSTFSLQSCGTKESHEFKIDDEYRIALEAYFNKIAENRKGYLSIASLYKLDTGSHSFGKDSTNDLVLNIKNIPAYLGTVTMHGDSVGFRSNEAITFYRKSDSTEVQHVSTITLDEKGWSDTFYSDSVSFMILTRNKTPYLRVLDPNNHAITAFKGFERFDINNEFIFNGYFKYFDPSKVQMVPSIMGGTETTTFVGIASFEYKGETYSFEVGEEGFVMLNDNTAGNETYGGGRYFYLELPETDGEIIIDFNKMYNPPCAFSKYTVCLFAPQQNHFPFKIKAGEKYAGEYE